MPARKAGLFRCDCDDVLNETSLIPVTASDLAADDAEIRKKCRKVGDVYIPVMVEIARKARTGGTELAEQHGKITDVDIVVAVDVARAGRRGDSRGNGPKAADKFEVAARHGARVRLADCDLEFEDAAGAKSSSAVDRAPGKIEVGEGRGRKCDHREYCIRSVLVHRHLRTRSTSNHANLFCAADVTNCRLWPEFDHGARPQPAGRDGHRLVEQRPWVVR